MRRNTSKGTPEWQLNISKRSARPYKSCTTSYLRLPLLSRRFAAAASLRCAQRCDDQLGAEGSHGSVSHPFHDHANQFGSRTPSGMAPPDWTARPLRQALGEILSCFSVEPCNHHVLLEVVFTPAAPR